MTFTVDLSPPPPPAVEGSLVSSDAPDLAAFVFTTSLGAHQRLPARPGVGVHWMPPYHHGPAPTVYVRAEDRAGNLGGGTQVSY